MSTKLERSQNAHRRLVNKYVTFLKNENHTTKKYFNAIVKLGYHDSVSLFQDFKGKVLDKKTKKGIFKSEYLKRVKICKDANLLMDKPYYIPKKYR